MITYTQDAADIGPHQLAGFFNGWPKAPSPEEHLRLLNGSGHVVLALDDAAGMVVGFVTAVTDGVLAAYVPFLEVLPAYRGRGIARELVLKLREALRGYYMIDLVCDPELQPFYESLGFTRLTAMVIRDHVWQGGRAPHEGSENPLERRAADAD
jgi:ribosomal protein S18 acetylase RimI-like enzyme